MPACDIYLVLSPDFDPHTDLPFMTQALDNAAPVALRIAATDPARVRDCIAAIRPLTRQRDIALMLTDLPELARREDCDGVHISVGSSLRDTARAALGPDLQLGIACGASRDEAMQAGEAGADYIALSPDAAEIAQWWSQVMELPIVAENLKNIADATRMQAAGVDFLAFEIDPRHGPAALTMATDASH